jgi:hypothetical protein
MTTETKPTVHQAIGQIMTELEGIGKNQRNKEQGYNFRGIDDVLKAVHPLLAKHGVFFAPHVLEREYEERVAKSGAVGHCAHLHVGYKVYGPGGDFIELDTWGEALDYSDKASNKAMTAAFKYAIFELFAVADPTDDADHESPGETVTTARATPARAATPRADGNGHKATEDGEAPHCPDDACDGRLRERMSKKGEPYLACDRRCGITPLWNTTTEQYKSRLGGQAWGEEGEPEHGEVSAAALLEVVGKDEAEQIFQAHSALPALKIVAGKPALREMEWNALDESIRLSIQGALANTEIPM